MKIPYLFDKYFGLSRINEAMDITKPTETENSPSPTIEERDKDATATVSNGDDTEEIKYDDDIKEDEDEDDGCIDILRNVHHILAMNVNNCKKTENTFEPHRKFPIPRSIQLRLDYEMEQQKQEKKEDDKAKDDNEEDMDEYDKKIKENENLIESYSLKMMNDDVTEINKIYLVMIF